MHRRSSAFPTLLLFLVLGAAGATPVLASMDTIGGDDVVVAIEGRISRPNLAIASDGSIFLATSENEEGFAGVLVIRRSDDGGDTWREWGEVDPGTSNDYPKMVIVNDVTERLYIAYSHTSTRRVKIAWAEVNDVVPTFTTTVAMDLPDVDFFGIDLATDAVNYGNYNLYLVAEGDRMDPGADIWFCRSTTKGATWEAPYKIGSLTHADWAYLSPIIDYGFGGYIHVAWTLSPGGTTNDYAVRYKRASGRAAAGIGSWDAMKFMTSNTNGITERFIGLAASDNSNYVSVFWGQEGATGAKQHLSKNSGADFNPENLYDLPELFEFNTAKIAGGGEWVMGAKSSPGQEFGCMKAPHSVPMDWDTFEALNDRPYYDHYAGGNPIALDPTRGNRVAMAWSFIDFDTPDTLIFDAEWRGDPGYPNLEDGFPVALDTKPHVAPALVDLAGDSKREIVFGDQDGHILVYDTDGQMVQGWPRDVGTFPWNGSIAVGDLNGDGNNVLVAGNDSGRIYCYDGQGELQPGWPVDLGVTADVHLAIGALGPPYARYVVACAENKMWVVNYAGRILDPYPVLFGDTMVGPPAIGDVDNDGVNEIVTLKTHWVHVHKFGAISPQMFRQFPSETFIGRPSLGDLDLNGDLEIALPTATGKIYVLEHTNADFPGWPFDHGSVQEMSNVAIADNLGTDPPELSFAARNYTVHLLYASGVEHSAYPKHTGTGWYLRGAPVIDDIDRSSANVLVAARDMQAWSWHNTGGLVPGWPKGLDSRVELGPATGDIDNDGRNEVVIVGNASLTVVDVNHAPGTVARDRWPMDGHDPQRTGCAACPEPIVTAVDPSVRPSSVLFRNPHPNPMSSSVNLAVSLPAPAALEMAVYDVRGRRVRGLMKEEVAPGELVIPWNGRDDNGAELASGAYFVRLRIRGAGLDEDMTRKVLLVR